MMHRSRALAVMVCMAMSAAAAADGVGWRTDTTGEYPDANPPTAWADQQNVVWSAPMPDRSNATPVIVGQRIFVCSEPSTLVCVDKATGQILWQHTNKLFDTVPEDEAEALRPKVEAAEGKLRARGNVEKQLQSLRRKLRGNPDDADAKAKVQEVEAELAELNEALKDVEPFMLPRTHGTNGYTSPTPVSDGTHVWVLFGNGVAACYDLDGNRRWIRIVEKPTAGWGQSSSPALADGVLVVLINQLYGLDAQTGQTIWQTPSKQSWGSPVAAQVAGNTLILTPNGQVVAPKTGQVLATGLGKVTYAAPVMEGDVAYLIEKESAATRLGFDDAGNLTTQKLWTAAIKGDRHYASPVIADGLIYAISRQEQFTVMDASDGSVVYEVAMQEGGQKSTNSAYPSVTAAGGYLFLSNESGKTTVIEPGRAYKVVATNQLEGFRASPVFEADRLYIRGFKKLWCLGQ